MTSSDYREITNGMTAKTAEGSMVTFTVNGSNMMVNTANVVKADIKCSNGVIHVIDSVLIPPDLTPASTTASS
jgi:transforming growth factor-beta-induced protein